MAELAPATLTPAWVPPLATVRAWPGCVMPARGRPSTSPGPLAVQAIGYLVPRAGFAGRVHSVFARACNIECGRTLLTLCSPSVGNGPLVLRLAADRAPDLRRLFAAGMAVDAADGIAQIGHLAIRWRGAGVWRPAPWQPAADDHAAGVRLRRAEAALAEHRGAHESVLDREAAAVAGALTQACRRLDHEGAAGLVARLAGWGESLTPAGDDFLVGLAAGLDAGVRGDGRRRAFRAALGTAIASCAPRTTPIAAQYLRLAAGGHYNEPLVELRAALLGARARRSLDEALDATLAIGATSGADTASGLLAGLGAWAPSAPAAASP